MKKNAGDRNILDVVGDLVSRRDHSALELRQKLMRRGFEKADVELALIRAEELGWIPKPDELAERVALQLSRKGKSHFYIQNYLRMKGLPALPEDEGQELEKARKALNKRFPFGRGLSSDQKIYQYLRSRGFSSSVIQKAMQAK